MNSEMAEENGNSSDSNTVGKTLYVTDLDGTLMRNDETLSAYTVQTINELIEKGLAFTYATARSIESARPIAGGLNLRLPAITRNGAVLADNATGKHLEKAVFTAAEAEMLKGIPELPYYGFVSCFLGEEDASAVYQRTAVGGAAGLCGLLCVKPDSTPGRNRFGAFLRRARVCDAGRPEGGNPADL